MYVNSILNSNCFLSAVKLSAPPSTTKLESKRQETKETVEGMEGRWQCAGLTFSFMCSVHLDNGLCVAMCSLPLNWACTFWPIYVMINELLQHYFFLVYQIF